MTCEAVLVLDSAVLLHYYQDENNMFDIQTLLYDTILLTTMVRLLVGRHIHDTVVAHWTAGQQVE